MCVCVRTCTSPQVYELTLHYTQHRDHNVVTASLELLQQVLRTPPPDLLLALTTPGGIPYTSVSHLEDKSRDSRLTGKPRPPQTRMPPPPSNTDASPPPPLLNVTRFLLLLDRLSCYHGNSWPRSFLPVARPSRPLAALALFWLEACWVPVSSLLLSHPLSPLSCRWERLLQSTAPQETER